MLDCGVHMGKADAGRVPDFGLLATDSSTSVIEVSRVCLSHTFTWITAVRCRYLLKILAIAAQSL